MRNLKAVGIIFTEMRIRNISYLCVKFEFGRTSADELVNL